LRNFIRQAVLKKLRRGHYTSKHIIEIMGNATGQATKSLQFLLLQHLLFKLAAFSNVLSDTQDLT